MTAVREAILSEIFDRLRILPGVAECERMATGDPSAYPALGIQDNGQSVATAEAGTTRYELDLSIEGYVEGGNGDLAHAELNELHAAVVAALMTEPPLGGLAESIEEGTMRVSAAHLASTRRLGFLLDFTIQFSTRRGDPAQR